MIKFSLRRRRGALLAESAARNASRSHWYRLLGMRRWALLLIVADPGFTEEYDPPARRYDGRSMCADDRESEPAPGTYWERAVLERFATGGPVDLATVRQQVAVLLSETPRRPAPDDDSERAALHQGEPDD